MKRMLFQPLVLGFVVLLLAADASAEPARSAKGNASDAGVLPPLSQRYVTDSVKDIPDFQKHIVPLMGRLGCNGRACHGSFQGRGGFQLSLFGYDFKADHQALMDDASGRVDVDDIDESLILAKPLDADMHEGGKRFDAGSWQHHVLRRWIESGATYADEKPQTLVRLEVTPSEVQFKSDQDTTQLRAVAHWQDGTREDVTELCRFSSNDDSIAAIDETGKIQADATGDTHVVVYYDNAVVPIPVIQRVAPESSNRPTFDHPVDQLVDQKLAKLGIMPAGLCSDPEFIRRVSLDITGILPTSDSVRAFLADTSPGKRDRLIDELLDSPGYAAWWATRLSDWTGNSDEQLNNVLPIRNVASGLWHQWLRTRLQENVPYDDLVERIVTANSRQAGESYREYCESMTEACKPGGEDIFAARRDMPLYWSRTNFQKDEDRAIGFAYAFLGVRIECAQCHKHPFDQWSKDDFEQFSKLFTPIRSKNNQVAPESKAEQKELLAKITGGKKLNNGDLRRAVYKAAQNDQIVPFGELFISTRTVSDKVIKARKEAERKGRELKPLNLPTGKILGQETPVTLDKDPRGELMAWLRSPENPYFAKAIVNRVWSNYFGIGIVDPSDDMNLANPPSNAPLLEYLATEFVRNDFDLRWLHRTITSSETYQRSSQTNATNAMDQTNFSRHVPRRLPAEVIYDSVVLATGSDIQSRKIREEIDQMAIAEGKPRLRGRQDFALEVFGQSIRESNCDCDRSDSPSLLQSIYLRNDAEMFQRLSDKNGWVNQACKTLGVAGPTSPAQSASTEIQRKALQAQRQYLARLRQVIASPEPRRSRQIMQLQKEHARLIKRMQPYGYEVPPFAELIENPDSWKDLKSGSKPENAATAQVSMDALIDEAYLRTLSRFPETGEKQIAIDYIRDSKTPADGLQSVLWALVNTKEFIISH